MEFDEVVLGRRSIRGYLNKPVTKDLIGEVLGLAMRAPTSLNTQPWSFYVVSGEVLDRIRTGNVERNLAGVPDSREFRMGPGYVGMWVLIVTAKSASPSSFSPQWILLVRTRTNDTTGCYGASVSSMHRYLS